MLHTVRLRFILAFGAITIFIALGMRHSFGFFLEPMTTGIAGLSRETFGFAIALQNLLWGIGQPFAGLLADRFGSARVIFGGGLLYAAGLFIAAHSTGAVMLNISFGLLIGLGLSGTSFAVVLGAVGRAFPAETRSTALGIASVGGSLGMFCSVPVTLTLLTDLGWQGALIALAGVACIMCVSAPALAGRAPRNDGGQSISAALGEAFGHRGYILLLSGFFVCGFQLAFISTHLPAYLLDLGLEVWVGGAALTVIGGANVIGTFGCGYLGDRMSKKSLLAFLYFVRGAATVVFVLLPVTAPSTITYAAVMGFTWLGTVPLTSGIVAQVFGPRYLATLVGVVFLTHQLGSFLGAWFGGLAFDRAGSYEPIWWCVAALGFAAALLHLPIDERPIGMSASAAPALGQAK